MKYIYNLRKNDRSTPKNVQEDTSVRYLTTLRCQPYFLQFLLLLLLLLKMKKNPLFHIRKVSTCCCLEALPANKCLRVIHFSSLGNTKAYCKFYMLCVSRCIKIQMLKRELSILWLDANDLWSNFGSLPWAQNEREATIYRMNLSEYKSGNMFSIILIKK